MPVNPTKRAPEPPDGLAFAENIIATLREPFMVLDKSLRIRTANAAFCRKFHASKEETEGQLVHELANGQWDIPQLRTLLFKILSNSHPVEDFEVEHVFPNIGRRRLLINARRFAPNGDDTELILVAIEDHIDYARADHAIRESELRYRRLFETASDGILILDQNTGNVIDANPFMTELLGYEHGFFLGKELWEIGLFKDIPANHAAFRELQAKGYIRYDHLPLQTKASGKVEVEFVSNGYEVDGRKVIQCNIRERTEASRLEQKIKRSLEEKEVLLKEVHHRVKNNLQVVCSLLDLQSQYSHDPATVEMFRESEHRVRSMAMVHERLYQSQEFTNVDFMDYIESLSNYLFRSYQVDGRISLEVDVRGVRLSIERAVPCGLLVNELVSNCLKHAFKGREHGRIRIELHNVAVDEILLAVSDDGVGLAPSTEPGTTATFGMQLVGALVNQLHGRFSIHREAGTTIRIVFPQTK
jgi:PAS domain S-box-containing protein